MADLCLPYPCGPRIDDRPAERRRKIAENLDAIADRARECAGEVEAGLAPICNDLRDGAIAIDKFEDAVR